jgi:hypothetical protein
MITGGSKRCSWMPALTYLNDEIESIVSCFPHKNQRERGFYQKFTNSQLTFSF